MTFGGLNPFTSMRHRTFSSLRWQNILLVIQPLLKKVEPPILGLQCQYGHLQSWQNFLCDLKLSLNCFYLKFTFCFHISVTDTTQLAQNFILALCFSRLESWHNLKKICIFSTLKVTSWKATSSLQIIPQNFYFLN